MLTTIEMKMKNRKGQDILQFSLWAAAVIIFLALAIPRYSDWQEGNRRKATMKEMRTIADQCALYMATSSTGQPPANLGDLVTGLTAANSNDGVAHGNFLASNKFTNDPNSFVDGWGNVYTYDSANHTLESTMNGGTAYQVNF